MDDRSWKDKFSSQGIFGIRKRLMLAAFCFAAALTLFLKIQTEQKEELQRGIASEVIRFHVLANSDSDEDQALKLLVRDQILAYLDRISEEDAGIDTTRAVIAAHLADIEGTAENCIRQQGYSYRAEAELVMDDFPERVYGDCTFPAGEYEALRVSIGEAKGHNWWCMVYPGLCFTEESGAWVSEENQELLKGVLTEDEFELVTGEKKIRFELKLRKLWEDR